MQVVAKKYKSWAVVVEKLCSLPLLRILICLSFGSGFPTLFPFGHVILQFGCNIDHYSYGVISDSDDLNQYCWVQSKLEFSCSPRFLGK